MGYQDKSGNAGLHVLDLQKQIRQLPKPVVAMVAGYAIGGGHVLHLVCDLTIAADNARFGQVGPKMGSFDGGIAEEEPCAMSVIAVPDDAFGVEVGKDGGFIVFF